MMEPSVVMSLSMLINITLTISDESLPSNLTEIDNISMAECLNHWHSNAFLTCNLVRRCSSQRFFGIKESTAV